jgi:hypothetical protein
MRASTPCACEFTINGYNSNNEIIGLRWGHLENRYFSSVDNPRFTPHQLWFVSFRLRVDRLLMAIREGIPMTLSYGGSGVSEPFYGFTRAVNRSGS